MKPSNATTTSRSISLPLNTGIVASLTIVVGNGYDLAKTDEARTSDNGGPVEPGRLLHSRNSGSLPRTEPTSLYNGANHCIPHGKQKAATPCQKDQQRSHLRGHRLAPGGARQIDRRTAEFVWWPHTAGHGASD